MNESTIMRSAFINALYTASFVTPLWTSVASAVHRKVGLRERKQHWSVSRGKR